MKSMELRRLFLEFFRDRGHTVIPSASLVPEGDPTLLFNIAGMVQFKQFYAAAGQIPFARAASIQKCLRATDLEEVGRTIKHHTFFEMLGNFSFGDYFKEEAIDWAWEFLTRVLDLPEDRLYVTVFEEDDESERIWVERIGVDRERIYRLGTCDNFWGPAGLTGACGPCSEIHFDLGEESGCGRADCSPACDCDRFVEVWNLVFPQFFQEADGGRRPLERRGVDTGMGLERLAMVCQGVSSTFETDLLRPLMDFVKDLADAPDWERRQEVSARVISDHVRALVFAISEGVLPSNEGRGYVVRRILRRAVVKGLDLGILEKHPAFLFKAAGRVVDIMHEAHPDLSEHAEKTALIIKKEEERFEQTLARGLREFGRFAEAAGNQKDRMIAGKDAFTLYDTYGFPLEVTGDLAGGRDLRVDLAGFEKEMEDQRERARRASKIGRGAEADEEMDHAPESFVGYDHLEVPTVIASVRSPSGEECRAEAGDEAVVELERTPFYPEGGGQTGDTGLLVASTGRAVVTDVRWSGGRICHAVRVEQGSLSGSDGVVAKVNSQRREAIQRNHTATHLLHAALRSVLGGHVRQSGSLVAPDRLRFDFTHYEPMAEEEIRKVEDIVNSRVIANLPVAQTVQAYEDAKKRGATALFGDKYGQQVRVIEIEDTSCELCGGTHVRSTGEIGGFRVASESGIAAGIRRIEAMTGHEVIEMSRESSARLQETAEILRVPVHDLEDGARKAMERLKAVENELQGLRSKLMAVEAGKIIDGVKEVKGIRLIAARVDAPAMDVLKETADRTKEQLGRGIVCVGSATGDRVYIVVSVDEAVVVNRGVKASAVAKKLGELVGGRGGGKDTFAQAGGKDPSKLDAALESAAEVIAGLAT
jgi:alanyl-tRNA synthetase